MKAEAQDVLRRAIGESLVFSGHLLELRHRRRIETYRRDQARLRDRYDIRPETPVRPWGPEVQADVESWAAAQSLDVAFATTSGSTAAPKRLAYPKRRLVAVKWAFIESFCRLYAASDDLSRHSLYVFGALDGDGSLTGMMTEENDGPDYISGLQAPYRLHGHRLLRDARARYGDDACRVWVLAL